MLTNENISNLLNNSDFNIFFSDLLLRINDLNSIEGFGDLRNDEVAELVRARSKAIEILQEVVRPIVNFSEKQASSEDKLKKVKSKVGL